MQLFNQFIWAVWIKRKKKWSKETRQQKHEQNINNSLIASVGSMEWTFFLRFIEYKNGCDHTNKFESNVCELISLIILLVFLPLSLFLSISCGFVKCVWFHLIVIIMWAESVRRQFSVFDTCDYCFNRFFSFFVRINICS